MNHSDKQRNGGPLDPGPHSLFPGGRWNAYDGAGLGKVILLIGRGQRYAVSLLDSPASLWVACSILLSTLLLTRLPFFAQYFLPGVSPDSWFYTSLAVEIRHGGWPLLYVRTPGYPLFLAAVSTVHESWLAILLAQTLLTAFAGVLMTFAAYRTRHYLAVPVSLGLAMFASGGTYVALETSVMSDSLYVNLLVIGLACLLLGLRESRGAWLLSAAVAFGLAVWTRPAGRFLLIIALAVVGVMLWNRYALRSIWAFAIPLPLMLVTVALYNWISVGVFAFSLFGGANLVAATATFWERDASFDPSVNVAIERMQQEVADADRALLRTSWDLAPLQDVFASYYGYARFVRGVAFEDPFVDPEYGLDHWMRRYVELVPTYGALSRKAIVTHPDMYLKFVVSNLHAYFLRNPLNDYNFWGIFLPMRHAGWKEGWDERNSKYRDLVKPDSGGEMLRSLEIEKTSDQMGIRLRDSVMLKAAERIDRWQTRFSQSLLWPLLYGVIAIASITLTILRRARDPESFFVMLWCATAFGAALVVSLVEPAWLRYSYVTRFVLYLAPAFIPLLLPADKTRETPATAS